MQSEAENDYPAPVSYSFGNAFAQGWELLTARYGILLAAAAISGFYSLCSYVVNYAISPPGSEPSVASLIMLPITVFISIPLQACTIWVPIAAARGEPASADTLFRGFSRYWQVIGVFALWWAVSIALAIPIAIGGVALVMLSGPAGYFLLFVFLIPICIAMLWLSVKYEIAQCLVMDVETGRRGPIEAFQESFRITSGLPGWSLVGLSVTLGLILLFSFLCLLLPALFFGFPFVLAVKGMAYQQLISDACIRSSTKCRSCGFPLPQSFPDICPQCGSSTSRHV